MDNEEKKRRGKEEVTIENMSENDGVKRGREFQRPNE